MFIVSLSILTFVFMTHNKEFLKITITPSVVIISHHSSLHIKYIFFPLNTLYFPSVWNLFSPWCVGTDYVHHSH